MRIRSTKPEFWRSETIASLEWDHRLILKGVESYVDDNGVGKDSEVLICADVFPHDLARDRDTLARVSRGLQALCDAGLLARYTFNGERLLYVCRWKSLQRVDRPNKGRNPRPDGTLEYSQDVDESICAGLGATAEEPASHADVDSRHPRDTLASVANNPIARSSGAEEQKEQGLKPAFAPTSSGPDDSDPIDDAPEPDPLDDTTGNPDDLGALFDDLAPAPAKTPARKPAAKKPAKTPAPEHVVTTNAYERTGKSFNFVAVRGIVKWAIHTRNANPDAVEECLVGLYEMGKPTTKTLVGQWLDGIIGPNANRRGPSKQDQKINDYLETGRRLADQLEASRNGSTQPFGELEP